MNDKITVTEIKRQLKEKYGIDTNINTLKRHIEAMNLITLRNLGDTKNLVIDKITDQGSEQGVETMTRKGKAGDYTAIVFEQRLADKIMAGFAEGS